MRNGLENELAEETSRENLENRVEKIEEIQRTRAYSDLNFKGVIATISSLALYPIYGILGLDTDMMGFKESCEFGFAASLVGLAISSAWYLTQRRSLNKLYEKQESKYTELVEQKMR